MRSHPSIQLECARVQYATYESPKGAMYGLFHVIGLDILSSGPASPRRSTKDPMSWEHVSVSRRDRCPTWDEMCFVRGLFWGPEEMAIQYHPAESEHVSIHPFCLHLWAIPGAPFPKPPKECV